MPTRRSAPWRPADPLAAPPQYPAGHVLGQPKPNPTTQPQTDALRDRWEDALHYLVGPIADSYAERLRHAWHIAKTQPLTPIGMMYARLLDDLVEFSRHAPRLIDTSVVLGCLTYRQAVRQCWALRSRVNLTKALLAEEAGCYPSHMTGYLDENENNPRELPAKRIAAFEQACGNRLITQWLCRQAGLPVCQNAVRAMFEERLERALASEAEHVNQLMADTFVLMPG